MKLGITGGIGSGKSTVVKVFEDLGAVVYHADIRAKELVYHSEVKQRLIDVFGQKSFENERYNTKYIASIVFSNSFLLSQINQIIHPAVFQDFDIFCKSNSDKHIVYESALMIETGHTHLFDHVILVTAPLELRIQRVMDRDLIDRITVLQRMKNQWRDEDKMKFCDFTIQNIDLSSTKNEVLKIWSKITQ